MARATAARGGRKRGADLGLLGLSAAGLLLSAYLLWARAVHTSLYCPLGSGCDAVQSSRYAAVFGIPVALLGLVFYGVLFLLAARPLDPGRRLALALPAALAGVGASAVFTAVQRLAIRATCSLCVGSALLTIAITVLLLARRPRRIARSVWAWGGLAAVLAVAFLLWGYAASAPVSAEQTYAAGLAKHLAATGARFYGAYWCPHCTDQKTMFGHAASLLPYVECDPRSPAGQPGVCVAAGIRAYPTWDINGKRYEGVLSLADLARLSGYAPPPASAP